MSVLFNVALTVGLPLELSEPVIRALKVLAWISFLMASAGWLLAHVKPLVRWRTSRSGRHPMTTVAVAVIAGLMAAGFYKLAEPEQTEVKPEGTATKVESETALFVQSQLVGLPITVPPGSSVNVVSLNGRRLTSKGAVNWGFYKVPNDDEKPRQWPDKKVMDAAAKAGNFAANGWKAQITNHGAETLLDVTIEVRLWFGQQQGNDFVVYKAIISPLAAGKDFAIHFVNDCPVGVAGAWPDTAVVKVLGESSHRTVPLRRTFTSPIDQIMMFMPSSTRLVGDHPCEEPTPTKQ